MVHRRPVYIYLFNVPSFSSRHFNKIKRTSRLGRLLALSLEILYFFLITQSQSRLTYDKICFRVLYWTLTEHFALKYMILLLFHPYFRTNHYPYKIYKTVTNSLDQQLLIRNSYLSFEILSVKSLQQQT